MSTEIKMTDETREYIEWYQNRVANRKAKKAVVSKNKTGGKGKVAIEALEALLDSQDDGGRVTQHIIVLNKVKDMLISHENMHGTALEFEKKEAKRLESAVKYIETSIALLESLQESLQEN